jgi:DUF1707 SHOCT-like domain
VASDRALRLSDTERDRYVDRLRDGLGDGRLEIDEFHRRLDMLFAARTRGDAVKILRDLPSAKGDRVAKRRRRRFRDYRLYLRVNAFLWAIWVTQVVTGGSAHDLWPLWVTIPWGVIVIL